MTRNESGEILAQARENSTSAVSLFSPSDGKQYFLNELKVCNVSGAAVNYRIFLDADGTTYDQTTALYYDIQLQAGQTDEIVLNLPLYSSSGNLAIYNSVANAINFTLHGYEITQ